jgi:rubrerythrin
MTQEDDLSATARLTQLEALDVESMELLYKLERSGVGFYAALADRLNNAEATKLLERSGREEAGHARRVRRALSIKLGVDYQPTAEMEEGFVIDLPPTMSAAGLSAIVQGEQEGAASYQRWADAESDPDVQRLWRLNGREEALHGERMVQVMEILDKSSD